MYTVVSMVAACLGIALVPASVRLHRVPGVVARKLSGKLPLSEIALATNKNDASPTTRLFVNLALSIAVKGGRADGMSAI
jgi:DNA-binding transcriptional LysR family regulator